MRRSRSSHRSPRRNGRSPRGGRSRPLEPGPRGGGPCRDNAGPATAPGEARPARVRAWKRDGAPPRRGSAPSAVSYAGRGRTRRPPTRKNAPEIARAIAPASTAVSVGVGAHDVPSDTVPLTGAETGIGRGVARSSGARSGAEAATGVGRGTARSSGARSPVTGAVAADDESPNAGLGYADACPAAPVATVAATARVTT